MRTEHVADGGAIAYLPTSEDPDGPDGRDPFLDFALRWWWLLLIGLAVGVAAVFAYRAYGPVSYTTTALVQVPAQTLNNPNANAGQARDAASNFAAEAKSAYMFDLVSRALAGKLALSSDELLAMSREGTIDIRRLRDANFISITVTDPDPDRARLLADTIAGTFVGDVNARAKVQVEARKKQLEEQIDSTRRRLLTAQLYQRREDLARELRAQRGALLQIQASYQQELQRQAEQERLASLPQQPGQPPPPATSPQLAATRDQWLRVIGDQTKQIEENINGLLAELAAVNDEIARLPQDTDPTISSAFAVAYSTQLQGLTRDYAQLQLDEQTATAPLVRYGKASTPLATFSLKKMGLMGIVGGLGLGAGVAFLIDLLRNRRQARRRVSTTGADMANLAPLLATLERLDLTDAPVPVRANGKAHSEADRRA